MDITVQLIAAVITVWFAVHAIRKREGRSALYASMGFVWLAFWCVYLDWYGALTYVAPSWFLFWIICLDMFYLSRPNR